MRKRCVERSKSKRIVRLAAANGSALRVEGDAKLEFVHGGRQCCMKFLVADVKRPVASVSAIGDFPESCNEHVATSQKIPMCRNRDVPILRLDSRPNAKSVTIGGPASKTESGEESSGGAGFRWQA